jgi:pimeloyl-ACP methyl ester carboxylesterase
MTEIVPAANTEKPDRTADVVFLHGLGGDARLTWGATLRRDARDAYDLELFWPMWLGDDLPDVGVWSVQYDAAGSKWTGASMPIGDRATSVLDLLDVYGLGGRPLIFVTHSMGGLIVKQMLQDLRTNTNIKSEWNTIAKHLRGIVFFSTPHNGSLGGTLLRSIWPARPGVNIAELAANNPHLRKLNQWFRNNIDPRQIHLLVYCETRSTTGLRVVDEGSADPGMKGVTVIPLDFDHVQVCKLASKDVRYQGVVTFIRRALAARGATPSPVRNDQSLLDAAESVVERFRELDSKISVSVSAVLRFKEDWTAKQREDLVEKMQALAYSELALSKARTAIYHLSEEIQARWTNPPAGYVATSNEIFSACRSYLQALCPNDRVTPFPTTGVLQKFLNDIVEAKDPAGVEAILSVAKTHLGMPEKNDLERAERALGSLRSNIHWRDVRRNEKRERQRWRDDDDDDVRIG